VAGAIHDVQFFLLELQYHLGRVLLSSYNVNKKCARVKKAETEACYEGIKQPAEWIKKPTIIESDCLYLVEAFKHLWRTGQDIHYCEGD
jgi:hypothetical protein